MARQILPYASTRSCICNPHYSRQDQPLVIALFASDECLRTGELANDPTTHGHVSGRLRAGGDSGVPWFTPGIESNCLLCNI